MSHERRRSAATEYSSYDSAAALKKIRAIVDEENANDAATARALRWLLRYGWIVLLLIAALLARLMGVY